MKVILKYLQKEDEKEICNSTREWPLTWRKREYSLSEEGECPSIVQGLARKAEKLRNSQVGARERDGNEAKVGSWEQN